MTVDKTEDKLTESYGEYYLNEDLDIDTLIIVRKSLDDYKKAIINEYKESK